MGRNSHRKCLVSFPLRLPANSLICARTAAKRVVSDGPFIESDCQACFQLGEAHVSQACCGLRRPASDRTAGLADAQPDPCADTSESRGQSLRYFQKRYISMPSVITHATQVPTRPRPELCSSHPALLSTRQLAARSSDSIRVVVPAPSVSSLVGGSPAGTAGVGRRDGGRRKGRRSKRKPSRRGHPATVPHILIRTADADDGDQELRLLHFVWRQTMRRSEPVMEPLFYLIRTFAPRDMLPTA